MRSLVHFNSTQWPMNFQIYAQIRGNWWYMDFLLFFLCLYARFAERPPREAPYHVNRYMFTMEAVVGQHRSVQITVRLGTSRKNRVRDGPLDFVCVGEGVDYIIFLKTMFFLSAWSNTNYFFHPKQKQTTCKLIHLSSFNMYIIPHRPIIEARIPCRVVSYRPEWCHTGPSPEDEGLYNHEAWYEGWYGQPVWFSVYYTAS